MPGAKQSLFLRIRAPQPSKDAFLRLPTPVSKPPPRLPAGTGFGRLPLGDHRVDKTADNKEAAKATASHI